MRIPEGWLQDGLRGRAEARSRLALLVRRLEGALLSNDPQPISRYSTPTCPVARSWRCSVTSRFKAFRQSSRGIPPRRPHPAYYDPTIDERLVDWRRPAANW